MDNKTNQANKTSILKEWPGAFGIYKYTKSAVKNNLSFIIILLLASTGIGFLASLISNTSGHNSFSAIGSTISYFVSVVVSAALTYTFLEISKGTSIGWDDIYEIIIKRFWYIVGALILSGLIAAASILLLIIPAFYVIPRLALVQYFVLDKGMSPPDAIKASWNTTEGNYGKIYGIVGVSILIVLPAITIIGIIATVYFGIMYYPVFAMLYLHLTKQASIVASEEE
ncbi:MAG: hypothetical protein WCJ05_02115 [bacterium]